MLMYLKDEKLEDVIKKGTVLVDFFADWCGPCQALAEELESIAVENKDVVIVKINVDEHEDIARENKVMSIPALFLYKDGKLKDTQIGFVEKEEILDWINK